MDAKQIAEEKRKLAADVESLIKAFNRATGATVTTVSYHAQADQHIGGSTRTFAPGPVDVTVEIG